MTIHLFKILVLCFGCNTHTEPQIQQLVINAFTLYKRAGFLPLCNNHNKNHLTREFAAGLAGFSPLKISFSVQILFTQGYSAFVIRNWVQIFESRLKNQQTAGGETRNISILLFDIKYPLYQVIGTHGQGCWVQAVVPVGVNLRALPLRGMLGVVPVGVTLEYQIKKTDRIKEPVTT